GQVILWNRHSALYPKEGPSPPDELRRVKSNSETVAQCSRNLALPQDLGAPVDCIRSPNGRVVVGFDEGTIEVFDKDRDPADPVDAYRVAPAVAGLDFDKNGLVIEARSGIRERRPFFDDLDKLMEYAVSKLPFEGDHQVTLPKTLLCSVQPDAKGCGA